jgi:hypothetical protein
MCGGLALGNHQPTVHARIFSAWVVLQYGMPALERVIAAAK